jgi:Zn finger protein HypA/HybF involved in hydrogenase expression
MAGKKVTCLDCDKEFDIDEEKGVCPKCNLNMNAILERDRHERALDKLRKSRAPEKKDKGGIFNW